MTASVRGSSDVPAALAGLSGTVLEQRYELGRVLGSGGMGAVFEARHLRLDRPVAIKVLRPAYAAESEYIERFLREAKAASKIRHRNVVEILDYGEAAGGLVYSVMEFLVGQDLQQLLQAQPQGRLSWARAYGLLVQIASGLKAAHGQGVIHRDIKPANCFLTDEDGEPVVKLVDFGIARLEGSERGHTLTGTAQVLGTPSYIAPELVRTPQPASPQSDVYALGVLAYRMLAGGVPFVADTVFELLRVACFEPVPSLRARVPEVPVEVEGLVLQMLAKEPERRPADMLAVRQRLVALGRRTLGVQAVEIPGSSALPLSVDDGARPQWSTEDTTVPRDAAGVAVECGPSAGAGMTEVAVGPGPGGEWPAEAGPGGTGHGSAWPRPAAVGAGAVPQPVVQDAGSSPSRSATTVPSVGESTLQSLEASGSLERPGRRAGVWVALGTAGALAVAGGFAALAIFGDDEQAVDPATIRGAASGEPEFGAGREPVGSRRHAVGTESVVGSSRRARSDGSDPSDVSATGDELVIDDDEVVLEESEPGGVEPRVVTVRRRSKGARRRTTTQAETESKTQSKSKSKTEPQTESKTETPMQTESKTQSKTQSKSKTEPPGLPADSVLAKKLQRQIKSRCARSMDGQAVTVKFVVTPSGGMMGLTANPAGAAAQCAKVQVQGTKFRPRSKSVPLKITAE